MLYSAFREAARECRRKKKEYVRCLERQVAILQDQNRQLIEELQKMKALCAGAFLDPTSQQMTLQAPQSLNSDRRLGGGGNDSGGGSSGMDFVDSVSTAAPSSNPSSSHHSHPLRKPPPSSLLSPQPSNSSDATGGTANNFHQSGEMDDDSSSHANEITLLKSPVSQNHQQQLLLLHGLSAINEGGVRKGEESDYSTTGSGAPSWMSSLPDRKPKFPEDEIDSRPPSSSPYVHPVKRVLKRFGNEQHRLSQQQERQQSCTGKPDPDKTWWINIDFSLLHRRSIDEKEWNASISYLRTLSPICHPSPAQPRSVGLAWILFSAPSFTTALSSPL